MSRIGKSLVVTLFSLASFPWVAGHPVFGQTIPILTGDIERVFTTTSDPGWLEGPAYDGAGHIWFTDLVNAFAPPPPPGTAIMRFDIASGTTDVVVEDAGGANGLGFDGTGRLIAAEGHLQRVTRRHVEQADQVEVLADSWEGMPIVSPNDLAFDARGGIYFTDFVLPPPESAVYYLTPAGDVQQVSKGIPINNGIALSPGGETLYVASTAGGSIFALNVNDDGTLSDQRVFASPDGLVPDGLTVDRFGNLYAADLALVGPPPPESGLPRSKVRVWNSAGEEVLTFEPPEGVINLTFGPPEEDVLYFTSEKSLWRVPLTYVPELPKPGDFDGDRLLTALDIDLLSQAVQGGDNNVAFDLNGDNSVNAMDRTFWVEQLAETFFGDADFDQAVQFSDFLVVAENFEQSGGWAQGDFDGSGVVQFGDFVLLSNNFGRSREAVAAVPEPSMAALFFCGGISLLLWRKRKRVMVAASLIPIALTTTVAAREVILGVPTNLGSNVNTSDFDILSSVSSDQLALYYNSPAVSRDNSGRLLVSTRASVEDAFGTPSALDTALFPVGSIARISADSLSLSFSSFRRSEFGGADLYVATRESPTSAWSSASNLGSVVNSAADDEAPFLTTDGLSLYFSDGRAWAGQRQRPSGMGREDIWVSHRSSLGAPWQAPENLGPIVNGPEDDGWPSLTSDGLLLFFNSRREGGYGEWDVWMSSREDVTQPWSGPVNLGPTVNGGGTDSVYVSRDGSTLYLFSDRPGGFGGLDQWQIPILEATSVPIDIRGGVYSQDFDEALGADANTVALELPAGWTGRVNNLVSLATVSGPFNPRRPRPNGNGDVFNGGLEAESDRALVTGVSRRGGGNELQLRAQVASGTATQLRLQHDVEAWGAASGAGTAGEAAFKLLVELDTGNGFEELLDLGTVTTGPTLVVPEDRVINGNEDAFRTHYDSGWLNNVVIPENATLRLRWITDMTAASAGWTFGLDNVQLELGILGDINRDGSLGVEDVDLISQEIRAPGDDLLFDLTSDGSVTSSDLEALLTLTNRLNGDADFDGQVQFSDFTILANNFDQADKNWSDGDFDSSGQVQFPDFVILANNFGRSVAVTAAVPEPAGVSLLTFGLLAAVLRRRRAQL